MKLFDSSLFKTISFVFSGVCDGIDIIGNVQLIKRSSRIKNAIKEILPLYTIFAVINVYIFTISRWYTSTMYYTFFFIGWLAWVIPMWLVCTVLTYRWYSKLWDSVYAKKMDNVQSQSTIQNITNIAHGTILSSVFVIQLALFEWLLSR